MVEDKSGKIKFSFEYYDTRSDKYCISCWGKEKIKKKVKKVIIK